MANKRTFPFPSQLLVLIHAGTGTPYAIRLNVRRFTRWLIFTVTTFGMTALGSLLFFREIEINRRLQDRVLEFQNREKLAELATASPRLVAASPAAEAPSAEKPAPTPPHGAEASETAKPSSEGEASMSALSDSGSRIAEISPTCSVPECSIKVTLAPLSVGTAVGQILVVLETEIPRIGSGNPTSQMRKRYFLYPGSDSRDELSQETLLSLDRKPFRISHALQTTAKFHIGKLLRPIAANVYLFDRKGTLVRHERKVIETEE